MCRFRIDGGYIPLSECYTYMLINNIDDINEFLTYIYALNSVHIEYDNEKMEQEHKRMKAKTKGK